MKGLVALTSSRSHNWNTSYDVFAPLNAERHYILDPCTTPNNPLKTPKFYTKEDDGLSKPWEARNFVNPPFNEIPKWLSKAYFEREVGRALLSDFLLPSRTGTRWFHRFIYDKEKWDWRPGVSVRFYQGRRKFVDPVRQLQAKAGSTFDIMIVAIESF